jgi:hypothetical protein
MQPIWPDTQHCITQSPRGMVRGHDSLLACVSANSTIPGDAAVALLKAGAEMDKKDGDGMLALELAPDKEVSGIDACPMTPESKQLLTA